MEKWNEEDRELVIDEIVFLSAGKYDKEKLKLLSDEELEELFVYVIDEI